MHRFRQHLSKSSLGINGLNEITSGAFDAFLSEIYVIMYSIFFYEITKDIFYLSSIPNSKPISMVRETLFTSDSAHYLLRRRSLSLLPCNTDLVFHKIPITFAFCCHPLQTTIVPLLPSTTPHNVGCPNSRALRTDCLLALAMKIKITRVDVRSYHSIMLRSF